VYCIGGQVVGAYGHAKHATVVSEPAVPSDGMAHSSLTKHCTRLHCTASNPKISRDSFPECPEHTDQMAA